MEPIEQLFVNFKQMDACEIISREKTNEIITRLNELSEMMNKKKLTLDEYVEKTPPKRFKDNDIRIGFNHYGMPTLIFNSDKDAQEALKLLTDNTN